MPTSFEVIYLGNTVDLDLIEGDTVSDNAAAIVGTTFGTSGDPLHGHVHDFGVGSVSYSAFGGSSSSGYDINNNETFTIDGGGDQMMDAAVHYNVTITYTDGSTATISSMVFQDTDGNTYLAPEMSANAEQEALEALPIESVTIDSILDDAVALAADRVDSDMMEIVDGTAGDDTMSDGYTDGDGDQIGTVGGDNEMILGGDGTDHINGGAGDDIIYTGTNSSYDLVEGGAGADTLYGESGYDIAGYWSSPAGVNIDLTDAFAESGGDAQGDVLTGFEQIDGSAYGDTIIGDDNVTTIKGWDGNDNLTSGAGDDTILGGSGNDTITANDGDDDIWGGTGNDTLYGGAGADVFHFEDGWGTDTVYGDNGASDFDTIDFSEVTVGGVTVTFWGSEDGTASQGGNTVNFDNIESVAGTQLSDTITASSDNSGLTLSGNGGADSITGGGGADIIDGGTGDDTLTGGAGDDVFTMGGSGGTDTITDFDMADADLNGFTNDQIDVSDLTGGTGTSGSVTAFDVVVTDDGSGNAVLTFPEGEQYILQGVSPATVANAPTLYSMGIPCFVEGTLIDTPSGQRRIEDLCEGDYVTTRDRGPQPIRWRDITTLGPGALEARPEHRPIALSPSPLLPLSTPILVSPQHRILIKDPNLTEICGSDEAFVRARMLARYPQTGARVARGKRHVSYHHLMLDRHEVLTAHGLPSESYYPGPRSLRALGPVARKSLYARRPELIFVAARKRVVGQNLARYVYGETARIDLRQHQFETLLERRADHGAAPTQMPVV